MAAVAAQVNANGLSPAETERLAFLIEECAEVQQAATKILRHGFESYHPDRPIDTNRFDLADELGHLLCALDMLVVAKDVNGESVESSVRRKAQEVKEWLHHQGDIK